MCACGLLLTSKPCICIHTHTHTYTHTHTHTYTHIHTHTQHTHTHKSQPYIAIGHQQRPTARSWHPPGGHVTDPTDHHPCPHPDTRLRRRRCCRRGLTHSPWQKFSKVIALVHFTIYSHYRDYFSESTHHGSWVGGNARTEVADTAWSVLIAPPPGSMLQSQIARSLITCPSRSSRVLRERERKLVRERGGGGRE